MDWDKLRVFYATVEAGSFTSAGDSLKLSQSAISRQISALEESLQTALFHRHARGLKLTEQGERLHRTVKDVLIRLSMAEALLMEDREQPRGSLKISTTVAFGVFWLTPRLKVFHERHPEITLTLMLDGGEADLSMREADVAIRMSPAQKPDLVQRRLLSWRSDAFAAPEYLRDRAGPDRAEDLDLHDLIVQSTGGSEEADWLLGLGASAENPRQPVLALDNICGLYRAVQSGMGIGALPRFMAPEAAGLIRLLPGLASPKVEGYFVYPSELRNSKRIAVFRDFLVLQIAEARLHADVIDQAAGMIGPDPLSVQLPIPTKSPRHSDLMAPRIPA
jgi:DNA-binding transcriptional LysR family regulator